jgi:DNA-binding SARP family transcriptional activator
VDDVVRVRLFGDMRLVVANAEVPVPNTRASVLLAALVLARGEVVDSADLRGLLWPAEEPASAENQIQRLVGQVRRILEPGLASREAGGFVALSGTGYRLDPQNVATDLDDVRAAVQTARHVSENVRVDEAAQHYVSALRLIRQPLLGDIGLERASYPAFSAIGHLRVDIAAEALTRARETDRLTEVVGLVEQLAETMPLEETLQASLIRSMATIGRRRDATARYEAVTAHLLEELGLEPGPDLRNARAELLATGQDTRSMPNRGPTSAARPAQLPAPLHGMTARPEAQESLDRAARLGEAGAVVITSIGGMGGIGKTTLAVAWAHSLAARFPDGQLYVNLRGFDPADHVLAPMEALGDLLLSLNARKVNEQESLEARSARFRSSVADKRLLILLDNARDAEQVRPLLPHTPGCLVLVTSRNQLAGLVVREGAVPVRLDLMTEVQARELLAQRLGAPRLQAQPDAVERIVKAAAGLPLALALVAARLALDPSLDLGAVAEELTGVESQASRMSAWSVGTPSDDLTSVFDWSYRLLDDEQARCFRWLAVHPGPELSRRAIASITGHDLVQVEAVISGLVDSSLLERRGADRFVLHDLLRDYAESRLADDERREAGSRMVGHYVRSTSNAAQAYGVPPVGELDPLADMHALVPETFGQPHEALDWYLRERTVLPAVLHHAIACGWDRAAANLAIDSHPINRVADVSSYTYPPTLAALAAAERTGDPVLTAWLHVIVGAKAVRLGEVETGRWHVDEARAFYARVGDRVGEANTLWHLADLTAEREQQVEYLRAGIALLREGEAPLLRDRLKLFLASQLLYEWEGYTPTVEVLADTEAMLREVIADLLENGWTSHIPAAAQHLWLALMGLSRPREALAVVSDAQQFARATPAEIVFLHLLTAEAALACDERSVAAQACRDFHAQVDSLGRDRFVSMVAPENFVPSLDPFARIRRVEAAVG